VRPAEAGERRRLNELFAELCRIPSPFGHERACAERVKGELREVGLEVEEDDAAAAAGAECGNLLARIPAARADAPSVLLCAHLDTVPLTAELEPVLVEDGWENAHEGILGADNKAAVAVILALARRCAAEPPPVGVELLFTVCEENALAGARAFDAGRLRSRFGYVFDHATPIGEIVLASPTYHRIEADFRGASAHAGIRPEAGRSAIAAAARAIAGMRLGRLDAETTTNVGTIHGGAGTNVVPARCVLEAEARSLEAAKVEQAVSELVDALHDGANAAECDVDVSVSCLFDGYRTRPSSWAVLAAERALRRSGHEPRHIVTGGGSDANALQAAGFECANLANGTERNHQPDERVSLAALEGMFDVALALLPAATEAAPGGAGE